MDEIKTLIASKLDELIKFKRLNQKQVSEITDISAPTISNWCNAKSTPDLIGMYKISRALNVPIGYFFGEDCNDTESKKIIGDGNHVITVSGSNNINSSASAELKECKKELEYFKILLQEKDARIEELKERIEELKERK